jgi:hypothetical protein
MILFPMMLPVKRESRGAKYTNQLWAIRDDISHVRAGVGPTALSRFGVGCRSVIKASTKEELKPAEPAAGCASETQRLKVSTRIMAFY